MDKTERKERLSLHYDCFCGAVNWDGPVDVILDRQWLEQCGISQEEIPRCLRAPVKEDTNVASQTGTRSQDVNPDSCPHRCATSGSPDLLSDHGRSTFTHQSVHAALMFVRGIIENLEDADPVFRRVPLSDYEGLLEACLVPRDPALQVKWIKHMSCWPMAKFLRNPLPEPPAGLESALGSFQFPLRGRARKHFKNLLASRTTNKRSLRCMWSLCQGSKRGCATVPEEFIRSSMEKHRQSLSQVIEPMVPEREELIRKKFRNLWHKEVVHNYGPSSVTYKKYLPRRVNNRERVRNAGYNACFENVRSKGGKAGYLHDRWREDLDERLGSGEILEMIASPPSEGGEIHAVHYKPDVWLPAMPIEWLRRKAVKAIDENGGQCIAKVAHVLEPLKCRLITKGNGFPYAAAMAYQKDMWEKLRELPQFALIGEPLEEHHLFNLLQQEKDAQLSEFDQWVSGDYSAATDGLSQQINSLCMTEYLNSIQATDEERKILGAVLGNHRIDYPEAYEMESLQQSNGQLMGSPVSFSVLCSINLAAYWCALEEYTGRTFKCSQLPVLVNGDDILFRSNSAFYEVWKKWIGEVGFTLSLGKNYIHKDVFTINSECFLYQPNSCDVGKIFTPIGFIHSGLLHSARSERLYTGGIGTRPENMEMPCIAKIQRILDSANDPVYAYKKVLHLWKTEISEQTNSGEYNLFVPCELGGLGLIRPPNSKIEVQTTSFQRKLAGFLYQRIKAGKFGEVDHNGDHDLTKPFKTEGKTTFVRKSEPGIRVMPTKAIGKVIFRDKYEPLREDEVRVPDLSRTLDNYQSLRIPGEGYWAKTSLDKELLQSFRKDKKASCMLQPFHFNLEPRVQSLLISSDVIWETTGPDGQSLKFLPRGNSSVCQSLRFEHQL